MSLAPSAPTLPQTDSAPDRPTPRRAPLHILVVDDDTAILKYIESVLTSKGISPTLATTVAGAEEALAKNPEFGVILCDHLLPDGLGVQLLHDLRDQQPNLVRILMTGLYDKVLAMEAINSGEIYRFLLKPFAVEDLLATISQAFDRHQLAVENSQLHSQLALQNEELRRANAELSRRVRTSNEVGAGAGAETAEWRAKAQPFIEVALGFLQGIDPLLYSHGHRVSVLATAIGQEMNLPAETLEKLDLAALFHDLGLLGCDSRLRVHQRQLAQLGPDALEQIEHHPNLSAQLVKFLPHDVTEAIRQHHEYFDGSGYPGQLAGDRISHLARILSVADCYDEGAEGNGKESEQPVLPRLMAGAGQLYEADVLHALDRALSKGTMPTVRQVLVSELTEGMKLSSSIYTKTGMLLVKQGQVLSRPIIEHLQLHAESNAIIQKILIEA